jgi:hypothetical protein
MAGKESDKMASCPGRRSNNNLRTVAQGPTERCDEDAGLAPESARNMMTWWMDGAPPIYWCLVKDRVGALLVLVL